MLLLLLVSKQVIGGRIVRQYELHCKGIDYKSMLWYLASIWAQIIWQTLWYRYSPTWMFHHPFGLYL